MKSYSVKRIAQLLSIDEGNARIIRAIVRGDMDRAAILEACPSAERRERECYNTPPLADVQMYAIDGLIGGYGVESIEKPDSSGCGRYDDYIDFVNTGDTYSTTILRDGNKWWIGCMGDTVERLERQASRH
jgi:hypothetical protein